MSKRFRGLSERQETAFGLIAINQDRGLHPQTVKALMDRGLVERYTEELGGRFPMKVWRYRVPLPVHMEWCEWCAVQETESR